MKSLWSLVDPVGSRLHPNNLNVLYAFKYGWVPCVVPRLAINKPGNPRVSPFHRSLWHMLRSTVSTVQQTLPHNAYRVKAVYHV